jgi:hypothetical protein
MAVLVAAAGLAGCPAQARDHGPGDPIDDPGDDPGDDPIDDPIDDPFFVDINASQWQVQDDDGHKFFFTTEPFESHVPVSSATISGSEVVGDEFRDLEGSFENREIHFTTTMGPDVRAFTGTFRDSVTMDLMIGATAAPIILKRNGEGSSAP